jgi:hypothetical protein
LPKRLASAAKGGEEMEINPSQNGQSDSFFEESAARYVERTLRSMEIPFGL